MNLCRTDMSAKSIPPSTQFLPRHSSRRCLRGWHKGRSRRDYSSPSRVCRWFRLPGSFQDQGPQPPREPWEPGQACFCHTKRPPAPSKRPLRDKAVVSYAGFIKRCKLVIFRDIPKPLKPLLLKWRASQPHIILLLTRRFVSCRS